MRQVLARLFTGGGIIGVVQQYTFRQVLSRPDKEGRCRIVLGSGGDANLKEKVTQ